MTAETEGRIQIVSRWKDIEAVDLLHMNGTDSWIICDRADFDSALHMLQDAKTVWIHEVVHRNADNRITFKVENSTPWTVQGGKLVSAKLWPRPDCQDVCHPCESRDA